MSKQKNTKPAFILLYAIGFMAIVISIIGILAANSLRDEKKFGHVDSINNLESIIDSAMECVTSNYIKNDLFKPPTSASTSGTLSCSTSSSISDEDKWILRDLSDNSDNTSQDITIDRSETEWEIGLAQLDSSGNATRGCVNVSINRRAGKSYETYRYGGLSPHDPGRSTFVDFSFTASSRCSPNLEFHDKSDTVSRLLTLYLHPVATVTGLENKSLSNNFNGVRRPKFDVDIAVSGRAGEGIVRLYIDDDNDGGCDRLVGTRSILSTDSLDGSLVSITREVQVSSSLAGTNTLRATYTNASGTISDCSGASAVHVVGFNPITPIDDRNPVIIIPEDDTTPPGAPTIRLQSPSSSPGTDNTPTFEVTTTETGGTARLYRDSGCTNAISSSQSVSSDRETLISTYSLTSGTTYTIYAIHRDAANNPSSCSSSGATYKYEPPPPPPPDNTPPSPPIHISSVTPSYSPDETPTFKVTLSEPGGKVQLYRDNIDSFSDRFPDNRHFCDETISGLASVSSGSTVIYITAQSIRGRIKVHAKHTDAGGNTSNCSAAGAIHIQQFR